MIAAVGPSLHFRQSPLTFDGTGTRCQWTWAQIPTLKDRHRQFSWGSLTTFVSSSGTYSMLVISQARRFYLNPDQTNCVQSQRVGTILKFSLCIWLDPRAKPMLIFTSVAVVGIDSTTIPIHSGNSITLYKNWEGAPLKRHDKRPRLYILTSRSKI